MHVFWNIDHVSSKIWSADMSTDHLYSYMYYFSYLLHIYIIIIVIVCPPEVGYMAAAMGRPAEIPTTVVSFHYRWVFL